MKNIFRKIDQFILSRMKETHIPSITLSLVKDGDVVYTRGYGFKDVKAGIPTSPTTLYGIGSITKSFTCLSIMKLWSEGKLDPKDPISKFLEGGYEIDGEPIRIWHLMTHSSGIPALAYAENFIRGVTGEYRDYFPFASPDDVISFMDGWEGWVEGKPGEKFFYLNEGYVLLGKIIENVSGKAYAEYLKENILEPLNMKRSYFEKYEVEKDGDYAKPYIVDREGRYIESVIPYGIKADGGLISNVLDLSEYIKMYLNYGEGFIDRKYIEEMFRPRIKRYDDGETVDYYGYGLGISNNFYGKTLIGHGGSVLVYTAYLGFVPEENIGVAILANSYGYPMSNFGLYALSTLAGIDPEEHKTFLREEVLRDLEGEYETFKGTFKISIKRRGDFLVYQYRGRYREIEVPLIPEELGKDKSIFYTLSNGRRVEAYFIKRKGKTYLIYERYKFVKTS